MFGLIQPYLKADIADLKDHYANTLPLLRQSLSGKDSLALSQSPTSSRNIAAGSRASTNSTLQSVAGGGDFIQSCSNEDVFAGPVSRTGFTLRLIIGGAQNCKGCTRCSWRSRCQGCVVPDSDAAIINLRDGETLSIDWHIAVFEELLDINAASEVRRHKSANKLLHVGSGLGLALLFASADSF